MTAELLTEYHSKLLSLTEGCTGSSESTHLKMPHCWKSCVAAHFFKIKVMIIVFLKCANDIMLLMVMEMKVQGRFWLVCSNAQSSLHQ